MYICANTIKRLSLLGHYCIKYHVEKGNVCYLHVMRSTEPWIFGSESTYNKNTCEICVTIASSSTCCCIGILSTENWIHMHFTALSGQLDTWTLMYWAVNQRVNVQIAITSVRISLSYFQNLKIIPNSLKENRRGWDVRGLQQEQRCSPVGKRWLQQLCLHHAVCCKVIPEAEKLR